MEKVGVGGRHAVSRIAVMTPAGVRSVCSVPAAVGCLRSELGVFVCGRTTMAADYS